ncbi:hypothetical protein HY464_01155 [Candidatus Peregrinibacteria bacterium]|nr:hypothetical protein [Candidatus Peregrinibacteria bacterium]
MDLEQTLEQIPPEGDPIINFRLTPEEFEEAVDTHGREREDWLGDLREKHIEPTERQAALVEEVFSAIEEKLSSYSFDIPAVRRSRPDILFLSRKDYWKEKYGKEEDSKNPDTLGYFDPNTNTVILWYKQTAWGKDQRNQEFLHILTHELLHAYSLRIMQAYKGKEREEFREGEPLLSAHRVGMYLYKLGMPKKERFCGLDEALTEDLAVEVTNSIINSRRIGEFESVIQDQIRYLMGQRRDNPVKQRLVSLGYRSKLPNRYWGPDCDRWFRERHPEDMNKQSGDSIRLAHLDEFEREVEGMREQNAKIIETILSEGYEYQYPSVHQAYRKERKVLDRLIMVLARQCSEYKGKEEELRKIFYEAKFSGSMVKLGRLIERTLGKGTFRLIAEDFLGADLQDRLRLYKKKGQ